MPWTDQGAPRAGQEGVLRRIYRSPLCPEWVRRAYHRGRWQLVDLRGRLRGRRVLASKTPPEAFRDKVRYKLAADRRPILKTFADKVAVREYVEAALGPGFLPELYLVTESPRDLGPDSLPRDFVLKPTHGSGACIVVSSSAPPETALLPLPARWRRMLASAEALDWDVLRAIATTWLERRTCPGEWAYRGVRARLLAEELLLDGGNVPTDYRVHVFNGQARLVQADTGRFVDQGRVFYSPGWERLDITLRAFPQGPDLVPPRRLADMLRTAEILGRETDYVRVDYYCPGDRLVVGELTSYPSGGGGGFQPDEADRRIASWWRLPERYTQAEIERLARAATGEP